MAIIFVAFSEKLNFSKNEFLHDNLHFEETDLWIVLNSFISLSEAITEPEVAASGLAATIAAFLACTFWLKTLKFSCSFLINSPRLDCISLIFFIAACCSAVSIANARFGAIPRDGCKKKRKKKL